MFGKDNLGKIQEINIKGLDLDLIIVYKYRLVLIAILSKNFKKKGIRNEAEKALDMFYSSYLDEIEKGMEVSIFDEFKKILFMQIEDYLEIIKEKEKEKEKESYDFEWFFGALKQSKNGSK